MIGNCELAKRIGATAADIVPIKMRVEIIMLDPDQIRPDPGQPRQEFDAAGLDRLAASLKKYGQLQPVLVKKERDQYILVAGERRWRAAKIAGMKQIQAVWCKGGDVLSIQLVENLLREDLKPVEQARAYKAIIDKEGWSARELARHLSIEQSRIAKALRLLDLDPEIQDAVDAGKLPHTTAYEITKQPKEKQVPLAKDAVEGRIKGDDLRKKPGPLAPVLKPVLTLGASPKVESWTFEAGKGRLVVDGCRNHGELISLLEKALVAARKKKPLAGGVGG